MESYLSFKKKIDEKLEKAFNQRNEILQAANWIAETIQQNGWIFTFGTGHSHLLAEEIFYRAGGLARIKPILDPKLMLHISASQSSILERQEGYIHKLLENFKFISLDTLIVFSNSGRNAACIEMALSAKNQGSKVIAITNYAHSKSVDSRHTSGLKLFQIADLFLDNFGEIGDAAIKLEGIEHTTGATSTIISAALLQAIVTQSIEILVKKGHMPELFNSANTDEGDKANEQLLEKYKNQVLGL